MTPCPHPVDRLETLFPARDYVTGDSFEIRRCRDCGLAITWPPPPPCEMDRDYPDAYYGDAAEKRFVGPVEALQGALYGRRARQVEKATGRGPGRVLDVGCGRGFLLDAFRRRGWTVEGTEMSEASSAQRGRRSRSRFVSDPSRAWGYRRVRSTRSRSGTCWST